jgi:hypothetical protein
MTMRPSVFDYDSWIPCQYQALRQSAEKQLPMLAPPYREILDESVEGELLQSIFAERRVHSRIWTKSPDPASGQSAAVDAWLVVQSHIHVGKLVKHICTCMNEAKSALLPRASDLYAQAYIALAGLYWTRLIRAGFMYVLGVEIHDSQRTLLVNLRKALHQARLLEGDDFGHKNANAKLYALFTGAQAERTLPPERRTEHYSWFNDELLALSKEMGILNFSMAEKILQNFLYSSRTRPEGAKWWGTTIQDSNSRRPDA